MNDQPISGLRGLRVLAVGTDPRTGPRAIKSLRDAGCTVISADRSGAGGLHGRSIRSLTVHRHPGPVEEPAEMARWVEAEVRRRSIDAVVPLSEDATRVLAIEAPDLGACHLAGPSRAQYLALCDKVRLAETAAGAGVAHPRTLVVRPGDDLARIPLPAVVKTANNVGVGAMPSGVALVTTLDDLRRDVAAVHEAGYEAAVQEYISGVQWSAHIVRGADGWAGLSAVVTARSPRGVGTPSILEVTPREDVRTQALALLDAVDYRGAANVQFIDRDGELFVHDVNLRAPATVIMPIRAGLDLPALGLAASLGVAWDPPREFRPVTYLWLEAEAREALHADRSTRRLLGVARMAGRRDVVVDPNPVDPFYVARMVSRGARAVRKRAGLAILGLAVASVAVGSGPGAVPVRAAHQGVSPKISRSVLGAQVLAPSARIVPLR